MAEIPKWLRSIMEFIGASLDAREFIFVIISIASGGTVVGYLLNFNSWFLALPLGFQIWVYFATFIILFSVVSHIYIQRQTSPVNIGISSFDMVADPNHENFGFFCIERIVLTAVNKPIEIDVRLRIDQFDGPIADLTPFTGAIEEYTCLPIKEEYQGLPFLRFPIKLKPGKSKVGNVVFACSNLLRFIPSDPSLGFSTAFILFSSEAKAPTKIKLVYTNTQTGKKNCWQILGKNISFAIPWASFKEGNKNMPGNICLIKRQ